MTKALGVKCPKGRGTVSVVDEGYLVRFVIYTDPGAESFSRSWCGAWGRLYKCKFMPCSWTKEGGLRTLLVSAISQLP